MAKSKSAMIMELKGRGMKGSLSRMNKSKLMELLESTAADGASHGISSGAAPQHAPITTAVAPDISLDCETFYFESEGMAMIGWKLVCGVDVWC